MTYNVQKNRTTRSLKIKKIKRENFYLVFCLYAYVPNAIDINAKAMAIIATFENSGTVGEVDVLAILNTG